MIDKRLKTLVFEHVKGASLRLSIPPHAQLIKDVLAYLINGYKQRLTLQDIANHIGISPFHLERLFKQETGETPRSYLAKIRIDKAACLLKSSCYSNLEICYEAGFQSPSNFYKVFRNVKQCSPSEFREKERRG